MMHKYMNIVVIYNETSAIIIELLFLQIQWHTQHCVGVLNFFSVNIYQYIQILNTALIPNTILVYKEK